MAADECNASVTRHFIIPFYFMKNYLYALILLILCSVVVQSAQAESWLDAKRRTVLEERREKERLKLQEQAILQKEAEAKELQRQRKKELKEREIQRERERQERELQYEIERKEREMERRKREAEERERERKWEEEQKERTRIADEEQKNRRQFEASVRAKLTNCKQALKSFDAAKGKMWVTKKSGLFLFSEFEECEEYVEYRKSKTAYAMRYARDLLDESVAQAQKNGHLKVRDNNVETLLPPEYDLRSMCENGEDVSSFETPESTAQYLKKKACYEGIVRVVTFKGDEFWVAYCDLIEYARPDNGGASPKGNRDDSVESAKSHKTADEAE